MKGFARLMGVAVGLAVAAGGGTRDLARGAAPTPTVPSLPGDAPLPPELTERIAQGESAFRIQDYGKVVEILDRLAGHPLLEGRPENTRVLEMLGTSHWFMGAKDSARLVFGQLLRDSPFHRLDEFVYPVELIDFFNARRKELVSAGIIPATPNDQNAPRRVLVREIHQNTTPAVVYFAPFGIGQFINGDTGKGTAMVIIQGLGAATMIASTIGIETLKVGDTNRIIEEDNGKQARLLDALWYGGMVVLAASWVYSIVDGLANRDTAPVIEEKYELLEPPKPVTLHLTPGPGDLGGLGLAVEF